MTLAMLRRGSGATGGGDCAVRQRLIAPCPECRASGSTAGAALGARASENRRRNTGPHLAEALTDGALMARLAVGHPWLRLWSARRGRGTAVRPAGEDTAMGGGSTLWRGRQRRMAGAGASVMATLTGMLATGREAEEHYNSVWRCSDRRDLSACADADVAGGRATSAAAGGGAGRPTRELMAALETLEWSNAGRGRERARAELRARGETVPRGVRSTDDLTHRNQIARLVADGPSNRGWASSSSEPPTSVPLGRVY